MPKTKLRYIAFFVFAFAAIGFLYTPPAFSQGSIFGAVQNADISVPANGEVIFFGYINGTDEEIRTESSIGAGYDSGNWFDDFQNYLNESAGQPYQYRFYNTANGEGFILDEIIPNNSFQQENAALAAVSWPPEASNPYALPISESKILIGWDALPDHTFHIYRRRNMSGGSFYRIDDPSGLLSDPGVSTNYFIDSNSDGISTYDYVIVAEDASGELAAHSAMVTVNAPALTAPVIDNITPSVGYTTGGTAVTISGSGFDPDGAVVAVGANDLTSVTVVSPFTITGETPAGVTGAADVSVTNTASGLTSNIMADGYTYVSNDNIPPVLYGTDNKNGLTGQLLEFLVSSVDADGDQVNIAGRHLPDGAVVTYDGFNSTSGHYEATFSWTPDISQSGVHDTIEILAYDLLDTTATIVPVRIFDNGYVCGDADGNWVYNLLDIIYLIGYKYNDPPGPAPEPLLTGDANGDGSVNLLDILYMIKFLYDDPPGPEPVCP